MADCWHRCNPQHTVSYSYVSSDIHAFLHFSIDTRTVTRLGRDSTYDDIFWAPRFQGHCKHMVPYDVISDDDTDHCPYEAERDSEAFPQNWADDGQEYPSVLRHEIVEATAEAWSDQSHDEANHCMTRTLGH